MWLRAPSLSRQEEAARGRLRLRARSGWLWSWSATGPGCFWCRLCAGRSSICLSWPSGFSSGGYSTRWWLVRPVVASRPPRLRGPGSSRSGLSRFLATALSGSVTFGGSCTGTTRACSSVGTCSDGCWKLTGHVCSRLHLVRRSARSGTTSRICWSTWRTTSMLAASSCTPCSRWPSWPPSTVASLPFCSCR